MPGLRSSQLLLSLSISFLCAVIPTSLAGVPVTCDISFDKWSTDSETVVCGPVSNNHTTYTCQTKSCKYKINGAQLEPIGCPNKLKSNKCRLLDGDTGQPKGPVLNGIATFSYFVPDKKSSLHIHACNADQKGMPYRCELSNDGKTNAERIVCQDCTQDMF